MCNSTLLIIINSVAFQKCAIHYGTPFAVKALFYSRANNSALISRVGSKSSLIAGLSLFFRRGAVKPIFAALFSRLTLSGHNPRTLYLSRSVAVKRWEIDAVILQADFISYSMPTYFNCWIEFKGNFITIQKMHCSVSLNPLTFLYRDMQLDNLQTLFSFIYIGRLAFDHIPYMYSARRLLSLMTTNSPTHVRKLRTTHGAETIEPWNTQQVSLSTRIMFIRPNPFFRVWEFRVARTHLIDKLICREETRSNGDITWKTKKGIRKINCICVRSSRRLHKSSQCHAHTLCLVWLY